MSATNTTTNYNLPIFIGSDKPAWLVDFNGAMNAIDAQMKVNADAIATKSPILTFNDTADIDFTKSGNTITAALASGVSDKVGRALVTPISAPASEQLVAINTSGNQDALGIGTGLSISGGVLNAPDINFTDTGNATVGTTSGATIASNYNVRFAFNDDHSIGKIYGGLPYTNYSSGTIDILTDLTVPAPDEEYDIFSAGLTLSNSGNYIGGVRIPYLRVDTQGRIHVRSTSVNATGAIYLDANLYFFVPFGDVE